jgi:ATP-dependent RNA helicase DDX24/MAK5
MLCWEKAINSQHLQSILERTICDFNMAPEQKKRARPIPESGQKFKKRQKIEPAKNGKVEKRPVVLDALPWNEVEMPDMFEDAEGFFGLEEVEGVEVIREGHVVKFVS